MPQAVQGAEEAETNKFSGQAGAGVAAKTTLQDVFEKKAKKGEKKQKNH